MHWQQWTFLIITIPCFLLQLYKEAESKDNPGVGVIISIFVNGFFLWLLISGGFFSH